jgi:nucleoside-diphosphate-sugar epimerase
VREIREADVVVHLAFPTSAAARRAEPLATFQGVVRDALEVVRLSATLGARHIVLASTGKVFGASAAIPTRDGDPPRPTTELGRLKLAAEEVVRAGAAAVGAQVTVLRIFNAFGPGQSAGFFFPTLLAGLAAGRLELGELDHARDWVHVTDVASALAIAVEHPPEGPTRALNVATGRATTVRDILRQLTALGHAVPEVEEVRSERRGNEAAIERGEAMGLRELGWRAETSLEQGIVELLGQGTGAR